RRTGYLPRASMRALASFPLPSLSLLALAGCVSEHGPLTNRMAQSTTPYLARAARQPVSWQPWGRDAFALAARLDRPILLYVGADDCRWCGVMDREVYGDPGLGAMIDSLFVPVRVDRDERPDVADRHAAAARLLPGPGGYPLTALLPPHARASLGLVEARAAGLMLATYARTGDPSYLAPARVVLDVLVDSADAALAESTRDDPPGLVRAALLGDLASGWAATGDLRYLGEAQ